MMGVQIPLCNQKRPTRLLWEQFLLFASSNRDRDGGGLTMYLCMTNTSIPDITIARIAAGVAMILLWERHYR